MALKKGSRGGSPSGSTGSIPVAKASSELHEKYVNEKKKTGIFRKNSKSKPKNKHLAPSSTQSILQENDSSITSFNSEKENKRRRHHRRKHSDESLSEFSEVPEDVTNCGNCCWHHTKGFFLLLALLIYHFLCFVVIMALGLGMGILFAVLHDFFWNDSMDPFWQLYVTLMTIVVVIEVYFRIGIETILYTWIDKLQKQFAVELFYIPRVIYFLCYIACSFIVYFSYYHTHHGEGSKKHDHSENHKEEALASPLSLSQTNGELHFTLMFTICLCLMEYLMSKENDWVLHRKITIESGNPDPLHRGGIGNFILYLAVHIVLTAVYTLPLVGMVFLMRQVQAGASFVFFTTVFIAILVGISAIFIERRSPFPTKPNEPPSYPYENHLRIRVAIFQLFLLPLAAGRYFNGNEEAVLSAQSDDFLFFTVEISIGIIQAIKIFGNWVFILNEYLRRRREEAKAEEPMEYYGYGPTLHPREPVVSTASVASIGIDPKSNETLISEKPEETEIPTEVIAEPPASFLPQKSSHVPSEIVPESPKPSTHEVSKADLTPVESKVESPPPSGTVTPTTIAPESGSLTPTAPPTRSGSVTPITPGSKSGVITPGSKSGVSTPRSRTPKSGSSSAIAPSSASSVPTRLSSKNSGPHYSRKYIS